MNPEKLREEIAIELERLETTVYEITALQRDVAERQPTVREKAAAAIFLAQFYTGIENILKRISHFYNVPLPKGEMWHLELFQRFCAPACKPLPNLFNEPLASALSPFRNFRHVVYHGYAIELDWSRMYEGVTHVADVFAQFERCLMQYLDTLGK
jgi:hypothetical protein